jgi:hypothetical protein
MLKLYYNGIKVEGGKLELCHYSAGPYTPESGLSDDTISITARDYVRFSPAIQEAFVVTNGTDTMTDYFEKDRIRVAPSHPLYAQVKGAYDAQCAHRQAQEAKRKV